MPERFRPEPSAPSTASCQPRAVVTDDADCLAHSISGWSQDYEQLKSGHFQGSLSELCFGSTQLFLEQTSHALRQRCKVPADHVWFGVPRCAERCVRINGAAVHPGRIAVHRGGVDFELVTPDALDFLGIVVHQEVLMDYAHQFECDDWLAHAIERPALDVAADRCSAAQRDCYAILRHPHDAQRGDDGASPLNQSLADSTLNALFSLLQDARPVADDRQSSRQRHRLVERADAYVRAHSDRLVTVSELCTELNTCRRALQVGFQEVLGFGPHAYIRAISLNGVRSHLRNPDSPYASVQDAAAAYGFWHMSQFAVDYRQLFGERPSDTLKRRLVSA